MLVDTREAALRALVEDSGAIRDTIEIVRQKRLDDVLVVAATFRRPSGRLVRGFAGLEDVDGSGWRSSGAWSSGPRDVPADAIWQSSGGWGSVSSAARRERGVSGGWVNEPRARAIRVTDPSGRVEEDAIEDGVGILIWSGPFDVYRATAELLDADGALIRSGPMRPVHS